MNNYINKIHLYKMTKWEDFNHKWHCNDITNLANKSAKWYAPFRMLEIPIEEYIILLVEKFQAKGLTYNSNTDYLGFYFDTKEQASAFCNYINAQARKKKFYCI